MIDMEEQESLQTFLAESIEGQDRLSEWERGFISDINDRFAKYGERLNLSDKQWATVRRIHEKATDV